MKRVIMIGRVSCGKTTLCQKLVGDPLVYKKTQTVEIIGQAIDTPGEYAENRRLMRGLTVTAVDADLIVFLQSCVDGECSFSPGQASMFGAPAVGVVTKTDLAPDEASKARAKELLELAGADKVFLVSSVTGEGIVEFAEFLQTEQASAGQNG